MAKLNRRSISRRTVEALKVDKDTVFWDRDVPGFGVRVYASGTKMYVVQSRAEGKSVRMTVGRHGVISADEARRRAARIVNRIALSPGQAHDSTLAGPLLDDQLPPDGFVLPDKTYDAEWIRVMIEAQDALPIIPDRAHDPAAASLALKIRSFFIAQNQDRHRPANATSHRKDLPNPTPMASNLCY